MFKGPFTIGSNTYNFISDAAQAWADEPSATILDAEGEEIPEDVIKDILCW